VWQTVGYGKAGIISGDFIAEQADKLKLSINRRNLGIISIVMILNRGL
jgi:hypothetical protein